MSFNFRVPNLTATTPEGKLSQMYSFLYQTVEQLNWALNTIETGTAAGSAYVSTTSTGGSSGGDDNTAKFNDIKALIIKSADIVNAYYEVIKAKLSGEYVAQSEFGTYTELTEQQIEANSTGISQNFTNIQEIVTDIETLQHKLIYVDAYINPGLLYYDDDGVPVYGLEIGQRTEIDGEEVFNKFARFTSDRLSFYDQNGYEAAFISDKKLYISHIEVIEEGNTFTIGNLVDTVLSDGSVLTR